MNHHTYERTKAMTDGYIKRMVAVAALGCCIAANTAKAQVAEQICTDNYEIDSARTGELTLKVDNISFLKDNEFKGDIVTGYTLPGFWLQPKVAFQPLKNLKIEAGVHAFVYDGAYKYPNYAYQDIARWKGSQYQKGTHLLPFFRAQIQLGSVNLIWGDLYGGSNHRLNEVLYNPELNLTADPEMGFQVIMDRPRFRLDTWIDWQSFIFKKDTHQEAFVVGLSSLVRFNNPESRFHVYLPLQGLIQHRGGELDTLEHNSVQTFMNGSAGVGVVWNMGNPLLRRINVEGDIIGYYEQSGTLWPFSSGTAFLAKGSVDVWRYFRLTGGWFYGKKFISLLGLPFFGAVARSDKGGTYDFMRTGFVSFESSYKFKRYYAVGAKADFYYSVPGRYTSKDGLVSSQQPLSNFSIGAYFRLNLDVLLWKHRPKKL